MDMSRREALKLGGMGLVGSALLATPLGRQAEVLAKSASRLRDEHFPRLYATPFVRPPVARPTKVVDGVPHYDITARPGTADIVRGMSTPIYAYEGSMRGPMIEVDQGTPVVVRMRNHLPAQHPGDRHPMAMSTHLHGSASLPEYDGYAADLIEPGFMKDYHFPNHQSARTIWYHDHAQHWTAQNVYGGLAAFYIIHDPWEREHLPQGEFDVPVMLSDAMFARDGTLGYDDRSHSGLWGDVILVNGVPWPVMKVKRRVYRFRFLAATLARSFTFRLSNGDEMYMVGTDGGIMPNMVPVRSWRHSGAERYEVLIDFRRYRPGTRIQLLNRSNDNNRDYDYTNRIMRFDVVDDPFDTSDPTWNRIPTELVGHHEVMDLQPTKRMKYREMRVKRDDRTNLWTFAGDTWQDVVASDFKRVVADPDLGDTEIWNFVNKSGGWFHPIHVHLVDFKILSRNGRPPFPYEVGPKDTVYVGENEEVKVIAKFGPHRGRYMVHCHNLPHEDHDMMAQFSVGLKDLDDDPHHPITAAPAVWDPTYPR